jgi:hypothetical protein
MKAFVDANRADSTPFDIIVEGETPGDDPAKAADLIFPWAEVGATWWNEAMWMAPTLDAVLTRIKQGPPRVY